MHFENVLHLPSWMLWWRVPRMTLILIYQWPWWHATSDLPPCMPSMTRIFSICQPACIDDKNPLYLPTCNLWWQVSFVFASYMPLMPHVVCLPSCIKYAWFVFTFLHYLDGRLSLCGLSSVPWSHSYSVSAFLHAFDDRLPLCTLPECPCGWFSLTCLVGMDTLFQERSQLSTTQTSDGKV